MQFASKEEREAHEEQEAFKAKLTTRVPFDTVIIRLAKVEDEKWYPEVDFVSLSTEKPGPIATQSSTKRVKKISSKSDSPKGDLGQFYETFQLDPKFRTDDLFLEVGNHHRFIAKILETLQSRSDGLKYLKHVISKRRTPDEIRPMPKIESKVYENFINSQPSRIFSRIECKELFDFLYENVKKWHEPNDDVDSPMYRYAYLSYMQLMYVALEGYKNRGMFYIFYKDPTT